MLFETTRNIVEKRSSVPFCWCYSTSRNEQLLCYIDVDHATSEALCYIDVDHATPEAYVAYDSMKKCMGMNGARDTSNRVSAWVSDSRT